VSLAENKNSNNTNIMRILPLIGPKCVIIHYFREISIFGMRASSEISRKIFNGLRFVCNRAHVRFRTAPCDFGKNNNVKTIEFMRYFAKNQP